MCKPVRKRVARMYNFCPLCLLKHCSSYYWLWTFYLLYGRPVTLPVKISFTSHQTRQRTEEDLQSQILRRVEKLLGELIEVRQSAAKKIKKMQFKQKEYYEKKNKLESYEIGDQVLLYKSGLEMSYSTKLELKNSGPYYIHDILPFGLYKIRTINGHVLKNKIHGNWLSRYYPKHESCGTPLKYNRF